MQVNHDSIDMHVGQCYGVLVTANHNPMDYYMVASTRFTKNVITSTAIICDDGSKASTLPDLSNALFEWAQSLKQFSLFQWKLTASVARPNTQGSFHYSSTKSTRTIISLTQLSRLMESSSMPSMVFPTPTPTPQSSSPSILELLTRFSSTTQYATSHHQRSPPFPSSLLLSMPFTINMWRSSWKTEKKASCHGTQMDTHSLSWRKYIVLNYYFSISISDNQVTNYTSITYKMEPRTWTLEKRNNYNLKDVVYKHIIQVFPSSQATILVTFDNNGMWNFRSQDWEKTYLGQQLHFSVVSAAKSLEDEYNIPNNALLFGIVKGMPKPNTV